MSERILRIVRGETTEIYRVRLLPDGNPLKFTQTDNRLVITGLPKTCPDRIAGVAVLEMQFAKVPKLILHFGCELLRHEGVLL